MGHEKALGAIHSGVFVITTKDGERLNGMTAAWVMRASFDPPLVAVSVGHTRFSHGMIKNSGVFAVNVLSEGQAEVGKHFGFKTGRNTDKFAGVDCAPPSKTGAPILEGIAGYLDCRVVGSFETGDHTIFVGEVVASEVSGKPPLLFRPEDFFG